MPRITKAERERREHAANEARIRAAPHWTEEAPGPDVAPPTDDRYYGNFLRDEEIFCRTHAPAGHIEHQNLVPLCEDEDGDVWGYTSVPDDAIARWKALPDE